MKKYYAGIGSRETPLSLLPLIQDISLKLKSKGYILRSGGALGADSFFESMITDSNDKEIILPWKEYNGNKSPYYEVPQEAYNIASLHHPVWNKLTPVVQKIMARNSCQILGLDLKTPVDFVVCWTKSGKLIGGTAQAMKIAIHYNIPIFNLWFPDEPQRLNSHVFTTSIF